MRVVCTVYGNGNGADGFRRVCNRGRVMTHDGGRGLLLMLMLMSLLVVAVAAAVVGVLALVALFAVVAVAVFVVVVITGFGACTMLRN